MRRIYLESVKKWAIGVGATGATAVGLIFLYLFMTGAIDVLGFSGDVVCRGTIEDPCYAYINFTAKEDIYIYPINYDPWGRDTPFEFDPNVKDWKLQRSWGAGWRTIDLTKPWSTQVKYAVKFSKGTTYNVRIVVLKNNEFESIKWTAFEVIDPVFLGSNYVVKGNTTYDKVCTPVYEDKKVLIKQTCNRNITWYDNLPSNSSEKIKSIEYIKFYYYDCSYYEAVKQMIDCRYTGEVIEIGDINKSYKVKNYGCGVDNKGVICDEKNDKLGGTGDGNGDGICQAGEKCVRV